MLQVISIVFKVFEAIGIAKKVWDALDEYRFGVMKKDASEQFDKGAEIAKKEKNTCELEKAFNPDLKC